MAFFSRMSNFFVRRRHPSSYPGNTLSGVSSPGFETGAPVETLGASPEILAAPSGEGFIQGAPLSRTTAIPTPESGKASSRRRRQPLSLAKVALFIVLLATFFNGFGGYSSAFWVSSHCTNPLLAGWALILVECAPILFNLAACLRILLHTPWQFCGLVQALKKWTHHYPWLWNLPIFHMYLTVPVALAVSVVAFWSCDAAGGSFHAAASHSLLAGAILIHVHQCVVPSRDLRRDRPPAPEDVPSSPVIPEGVWSNPHLQTVP